MSTITTLASGDNGAVSRSTINTNFVNLNTDKIETSYIDTDTALTANSDTKIATQKATKAYVDAQILVDPLVDIASPVVRTYLNAASPATWTKPAGIKYVIVEVQAAGGSTGNTTNTDGATGGAGGGGYSKKLIAAASLGATETVTIGAVGASSSFGSHCSANSGSSTTSNVEPGSVGGSATGGDINITGQTGGRSLGVGSAIGGGAGGDSILGFGGARVSAGSDATAGVGYGGGASGSAAAGSADENGATGAPGIVIVTEYYV